MYIVLGPLGGPTVSFERNCVWTVECTGAFSGSGRKDPNETSICDYSGYVEHVSMCSGRFRLNCSWKCFDGCVVRSLEPTGTHVMGS